MVCKRTKLIIYFFGWSLFVSGSVFEKKSDAGLRSRLGLKKKSSRKYQVPANRHEMVRRLGDLRREKVQSMFSRSKHKEVEERLLEALLKKSRPRVVSEVPMWEALNHHSIIEKELALAQATGKLIEPHIKKELSALYVLRVEIDAVRRKTNSLSSDIKEFLLKTDKKTKDLNGLKNKLKLTKIELDKSQESANEVTSSQFELAVESLHGVKKSLEGLLLDLELDLELAEGEMKKDDLFYTSIANQQNWI